MATVKKLGRIKLPGGLSVTVERHGQARARYIVFRTPKGWRLDGIQAHNTWGWIRIYEPKEGKA